MEHASTGSDRPSVAAALPRHPRRRDGLRVEELDGEALVFDPVTADTHRLNETALFIWRCCDGRAVEEIAQGMCDAYDVGFEEATGHVERMVSELGERALVSEATDDGSGTA